MNSHKFETQIAIDFNVETALLLEALSFWLQINCNNKSKKHFHDGRWWLYNSYDAWTELLPYYTAKQIRRILTNAERNGLIITGNYNKRPSDLTKWYTLTEKALCFYPLLKAQLLSPPAQTGKALPDTYPDINTTSEQSSPEVPILSEITPLELVTVFVDELPDNPRPLVNVVTKAVESKTRVAISKFKAYWKERMSGKPLTENGFRAYLRGLKDNCPGFVNNEYTNKGGRTQRNGLNVFLKWETLEGYLNKTIY